MSRTSIYRFKSLAYAGHTYHGTVGSGHIITYLGMDDFGNAVAIKSIPYFH
jgi:hypothetical protein